jgi:hypothetical protein
VPRRRSKAICLRDLGGTSCDTSKYERLSTSCGISVSSLFTTVVINKVGKFFMPMHCCSPFLLPILITNYESLNALRTAWFDDFGQELIVRL